MGNLLVGDPITCVICQSSVIVKNGISVLFGFGAFLCADRVGLWHNDSDIESVGN